jgi:hypothetical protein
MRARLLTASVLAVLAYGQVGCGEVSTQAAAYTCGYMRDTAGAFREQARDVVQRAGLRADRLALEEVVLDAEFVIRRACDGAADDARPTIRTADISAPGLVSAGSAR